MGNREKLLEGAKRCLYEKGYAHTTARDIVAASGTNLASIGYHFGSKEALLTAAMVDGFRELGEELVGALSAVTHGSPIERFEAMWSRVIETFTTHRPLWVASFEAFVQAERSPELRALLSEGYEQSRPWMAARVLPTNDAGQDTTARAVGSLLLALQAGLAAQWLLDPEGAPTADELTDAMKALLETDTTPARRSSRIRSTAGKRSGG